MTWRLEEIDTGLAYTLRDASNNAIAEINFYDTTFGTDADRENNRAVATLAAAAPDMLNALQQYAMAEFTKNPEQHELARTARIIAMIKALGE